MTQTKQPHSLAHIQEEEIDLSFNCYKAVKEAKTNVRKNIQLLDSLCDSMSVLCTKLDRLDNLMETFIFSEEKEKGK